VVLRDRLQTFIEEIQLDVWWSKTGEDGEDQRLHGGR
jgi:hypothetical protein